MEGKYYLLPTHLELFQWMNVLGCCEPNLLLRLGVIRLSRRLLGSRFCIVNLASGSSLRSVLSYRWQQLFWHLSSSCNLQGSSCFLMGDSCCLLGLSSLSLWHQGQEFFINSGEQCSGHWEKKAHCPCLIILFSFLFLHTAEFLLCCRHLWLWFIYNFITLWLPSHCCTGNNLGCFFLVL